MKSTAHSAILLLAAVATLPATIVEDRPNDVVIYIDDMGYADFGSFGASTNGE